MRIDLKKALHLLKIGHVVAVPTETVYGLAASLACPTAIQEIYRLKGRPSNNPLIVHVSKFHHLIPFIKESVSHLELLAARFWPGPMTLVLPVKCELIPSIVRADLPTAAFRIPQHPITQELLELTGPLVMPSANISGHPSSTRPEHVENDFGLEFPVLEGGDCHRGLESTILIHRAEKWEIIRQGALYAQEFKDLLGYSPIIQERHKDQVPICPGQMYRHYAPKAKLKLIDSFEHIHSGVVIGFSDRIYPSECHLLPLGPISKPDLAASNLYATLRHLDEQGYEDAYVDINFPPEGILSTLRERLYRAAS